jgi:putative Mn2+ efflux pump MntP
MMPVLGWSAGLSIRDWIADYDHWVAFGLLAFVAQGMLRAAFKKETNADERKDPTKGLTMVMLSVATSIDALAVGLSLSMISVSIWTPALIIGLVAGAFTTAGMHLGKKIGSVTRMSHYAEALGGVVLLLIGFNILREHQWPRIDDCGNSALKKVPPRESSQSQVLIDQYDLDSALGIRFFMDCPYIANSSGAIAVHAVRSLDARCFLFVPDGIGRSCQILYTIHGLLQIGNELIAAHHYYDASGAKHNCAHAVAHHIQIDQGAGF